MYRAFQVGPGEKAEWRNGGIAEWRNGGIAEWRNGGIADPKWRNGGMDIILISNQLHIAMLPL